VLSLPSTGICATSSSVLNWHDKTLPTASTEALQPGKSFATLPASDVFVPAAQASSARTSAPDTETLSASPNLTFQMSTSSAGDNYPIPSSPYGQVGDPYGRALNWPSKAGAASRPSSKPRQEAVVSATEAFAPVPSAGVHPSGMASLAVPVPLARPVAVSIVALPKSLRTDLPTPPHQGAENLPSQRPSKAQVTADAKAPSHMTNLADAMPKQAGPGTGQSPEQVLAHPNDAGAPLPTSGYQVPASSKYAARLQALHATDTTKTIPGSATVPSSTGATSGSDTLATQDTDRIFVPGEHYSDASDEPRYYSLHRQYGLTPDPISVDHVASGALLTAPSLETQSHAADDQDASDTPNPETRDGNASGSGPVTPSQIQPQTTKP